MLLFDIFTLSHIWITKVVALLDRQIILKSWCAKTAFVFMIKSLLSEFKEVAHILPVRTIKSDELYIVIRKISEGFHSIGFKVSYQILSTLVVYAFAVL